MLATSPSRLILLASGSNAAATRKLVPGGVTKHLYYGIFQNYIGFVVYDFFLSFFHARLGAAARSKSADSSELFNTSPVGS